MQEFPPIFCIKNARRAQGNRAAGKGMEAEVRREMCFLAKKETPVKVKERGDLLVALDKSRRESRISLTEFRYAHIEYKGMSAGMGRRIAMTLHKALSFVRKNGPIARQSGKRRANNN